MRGKVEFRILGPLEVRVDAARLPLRGPRQETALAVLLLASGQTATLAQLVDAVWDDPPSTARRQVQDLVTGLRRSLAGRAGREDLILTQRSGYLMRLATEELDAHRFDQFVATARAATSRRAAADALRAALELCRGHTLAGITSHALAPAVARWEEHRLAIREEWFELELSLGNDTQLLGELFALVAQQPLRERPVRLLMRALHRCGRSAEALSAYQQFQQRLTEGVGIDPSTELRELHRAILRGDPDPACEPGTLVMAAPPAAREAAPATPAPPAQLPADMYGFAGRARELAQLDAALASSGQQPTAVIVSAVSGAAGVGKTALAVHWAHRVADRFPDGQLHLNLHGYGPGGPISPLQALAQLLRSLGVAAESVPVEVDEAAALYRSLLAGRRMLVLLDNAAAAEQVRQLLPGRPGCMAMITSRDRLAGLVASHGAHRLTLDVLTEDEAVALLANALGSDRAAAEPDAIRELARACACLPLALRIAAANLAYQPDRSVAGYVAGLRGGGDPLTDLVVPGDPDTAVRTAFDHSYHRLPSDAQHLFALLGVVPGPDITAPAAAALAAIPTGRASRLLDQLAGAHLLEVRAPDRFGCHDLLRCYAREQLPRPEHAPDREPAARRLLGWYLQAADSAAGLLYPGSVRLPVPAADPSLPAARFDDHAGALAWLTAEWENLVAAVTHWAEHGHPRLAWLLADTLRGFLWIYRNPIDQVAIAGAGLAAARHGADLSAQAAAELSLGDAHQCMGSYPQANAHYLSAGDLACQAGWPEVQAAAHASLGLVCGDTGDLVQAIAHQTTALNLHRQGGAVRGQATALGNLGTFYCELGDLERAAEHQELSLALNRQIGSRVGEANCLGNLGEVAHAQGRLAQAIDYLTRAYGMHREIGDRCGQAYGLSCLAAVHADTGHPARALGLATTALALAGEIGDPGVEACVHNAMGTIHLRQGHHEPAAEHHRQALQLARAAGTRYAETSAQLGLSAAHRHAHQPVPAIEHAERALAVAAGAGYRLLEGLARSALADVHLGQGQHRRAAYLARRALAIQRDTGHRLAHARTLVTLGHALRSTGRTAAARSCWYEALTLFNDIGSPEAGEPGALLAAARGAGEQSALPAT